MKINISKLIDGAVDDLSFEMEFNIKETSYDNKEIDILKPVSFTGNIKYADDGVFELKGEINSDIILQCARCLREHKHHLSSQVDFLLVDKSNQKEDLPDDSIVFEGDTIDLYPIAYEHFVLSIPSKVLCDHECKGLCPKCGINRNISECSCKEDKYDPRLEVLKGLFDNN